MFLVGAESSERCCSRAVSGQASSIAEAGLKADAIKERPDWLARILDVRWPPPNSADSMGTRNLADIQSEGTRNEAMSSAQAVGDGTTSGDGSNDRRPGWFRAAR